MTIGEKIRNKRIELNMTQRDLGKLLYVSEDAVQKWETNKNSIPSDKMKELCSIFNVKSSFFFDENNNIDEDFIYLQNLFDDNNFDRFYKESANGLLAAYKEIPNEKVLVYAISLFLTEYPKESDMPFAYIPCVTGGLMFAPHERNLHFLIGLNNVKWTPRCGILLHPQARLGDGKNNIANVSQLAVIFENLRALESERQECDLEEIQKPLCLQVWDCFNLTSMGLNH